MSWLSNTDVQTEAQRWLNILRRKSEAFYIGCGRNGKPKRKLLKCSGDIEARFAGKYSETRAGAVIAPNKLNAKRTNGD